MTEIKKIIIMMSTMIIVILCAALSSNSYIYAYSVSVKGMTETQRRLTASIVASVSMDGEDATAQLLLNETIPSGVYSQEDWKVVLNECISNGYFKNYVNDFINAGIQVSSSGSSSSNASNKEQIETKPKTEFSVEDVAPYFAWTTKNCNIRSGADTTYDKVGSLKKNEEVTVTGKASTGWFRITTSSGVKAYISNSLLTTDDPKSVTFKSVEENGDIVTTTVEGENAEAVAKVVEEIQAEEAADEPEPVYTSKVTKEATCTETGVITYTSENGDSYTEEIPMLEHTPGEWEITKKATPFSKGEKVQKCTQCGEALATEDIPQNMIALYIIIGAIIATLCAIGIIVWRKQHG